MHGFLFPLYCQSESINRLIILDQVISISPIVCICVLSSKYQWLKYHHFPWIDVLHPCMHEKSPIPIAGSIITRI